MRSVVLIGKSAEDQMGSVTSFGRCPDMSQHRSRPSVPTFIIAFSGLRRKNAMGYEGVSKK